jgi:hypothetical protein
MIAMGAVGEHELDLYNVTDELDEAMHPLHTPAVARFGLRRLPREPRRRLGERGLGPASIRNVSSPSTEK